MLLRSGWPVTAWLTPDTVMSMNVFDETNDSSTGKKLSPEQTGTVNSKAPLALLASIMSRVQCNVSLLRSTLYSPSICSTPTESTAPGMGIEMTTSVSANLVWTNSYLATRTSQFRTGEREGEGKRDDVLDVDI